MKKLFLTIIHATIALAGMSQNIGEAFYIYRNDGQFNAFFRDEVQSIEYSCEDEDGNTYDEIVTQIVNTPDSIYKIPLSAIDSVGFVTPETIFQSNVVRMNASWIPYVVGITDSSISFLPSTPESFLPKQGQVLVTETFEHPFETGFSGRVTHIDTYSDRIVFEVEDILLSDIYQRLVTVGNSTSEGMEQNASHRSRRIWGNSTNNSVRFDIDPIVGLTVGPVSISCTPTITMKYIVCLWEENLKDYVDIRCYQTYDGSVSINASLDKGFTPEPIWFGPGIAVPTPVPGLYGRVQLGGFFRASGSVQLSATRNFYREGVSGFVYSEDSGFTRINEWKNPPEEDWEASISIDGSLSAGLAGRLQFGLVHEKLASADITLYVGPEISGHAELNATELTVDNNLYSAIKNSEITLSIIADVVPGYQLVGFKSSKVMPEPPTHQDTPVSLKFTWPLNHWYLVPEFDNLKWQADTDGGDLSGDISRNLLPKVALGWVLYDENDNIYKKEYFNESYRKLEDWPHQGLSYHLDNVNKSTTYRAYPLVSLMGVEMRADKSVDVCVRYPVKITDFELTDSHYEKVAFTNNGQMYSYKFDCAVTVELTNGENVKDWGYAYEDPDHEIKHISLKGKESPYTDTNYAFYRNEPIATATLYGYVKYIGDDNYYYGEKKEYDLIYDKQPKAETLDPTEVNETSAKVKCAYHEAAPWGGTCGIEYWEDTNVNDAIRTYFETASDEIEIPINSLKPNTVYYYQALIKVDKKYVGVLGIEKEDIYSDEIKTFTTKPHVVISSYDVINVKTTSATLTGTVEGYDPADESIKFAFMYSNESDLANSSNGFTVPAQYDGNGNLTAEISGLSDFTTYYYTLAIKRGDAAYETSEVKSFKTLPVVTTLDNATSTYNSATLQGTCSKGITTAGFAIKKDDDSEFTTYSASVDANGNISATIDGLDANTTYKYYAFIQADGKTYNGTELSFTTKGIQLCPDANHPHMIDLELPSGTKWACCNLNASRPEDYGSYYAWGETMPKSNFTWQTYQYGRSAEDVDYIGSNIAGTSYDAAFAALGDDYQTPSMELCKELINSTESKWVSINGVQGRIFIGTNGASIFLPAVGCRIREEIRYAGESGHYWTSTYHNTEPRLARGMTVSANGASYQAGGGRFNGHPVRPIQPGIIVQTCDATEINSTSAILNGTVKNYAKSKENVKLAFVYSTSEDIINSADGKTIEVNHTGDGNMSVEISDLSDYTTYYYAATYKLGNADYILGEVKSFKTLPVVTTLGEPSVTVNSATLQGSCSKGIMTAGFAIKKDDDSEFTTYSASVDAKGNISATIDGLDANTTYKYYAFIQADGKTYNGTELSFTTNEIQLCPDDNHPHMIDLGLPSGTKWACCNVGASKPDDYGGYYTVGEAYEKDDYSWSNYPYALIDLGENISGTSYDVAHILWGNDWVTPTKEQLQELIDNTTFEATFINGVFGGMFINAEGKSIFLPAAGYKITTEINAIKENIHFLKNERGTYWTATQYAHRENDTDSMYEMYFSREYGDDTIQPPTIDAANNFWGLTIRAIKPGLK